MLEKPDIQDETILACLEAEYGLRVTRFEFLPLGQDRSTAVYRAVAEDETATFCKLKFGAFDEVSVELPKFLSEQGIAQIIPPLVTRSGRLWAEMGETRLVLYPFVEGKDGYEAALSERQWADFGAAMKQIHSTALPAQLSRKIQKENYSPEWRERCRDIIQRLDDETLDVPGAAELAAFLNSKRETILDLAARAEQLANAAGSRPTEFVLCHSDIHPGNLFLTADDRLYIVDWDYPTLSLKERDLMYIGDGQGFICPSPQEEERLFARGYGDMQIDPIGLAYYRYQRNVVDISVECERLFSSTFGDQDRKQSFEILQWYFKPGCAVELAYQSDRTR